MGTAGLMPSGFPTAIARCSWELGMFPDAHGDQGHHWVLAETRDVAGC